MEHPLDDAKELRALYNIRLNELHNFSTGIWAFPSAFAALVAAEYRFLFEKPGILICAAIFNLTLCYGFWKVLYNRECVLKALRHVEEKFSNKCGAEFVPHF